MNGNDDTRVHVGEIVPTPDPTRLTTSQLLREVGAVRELLEEKISGIRREIARLASDFSVELKSSRDLRDEKFRSIEERMRECDARSVKGIQDAVDNIREIRDQKFRAVEIQMDLHAKANESAERSSKDAVEKAFLASEKAVQAALEAASKAVAEQNRAFNAATAKSEEATDKRLIEIGSTIKVSLSAINDKIDVLNSRITTMEGSGKGSRDLMAIIFTIAGIAIAAVAAFIAFSKA